VPASAAVDDAVALTKRFRKKSAAGFVNAVLRAISRQRDHLPLPARPAEADRERALAYLSVTLSHPRWLAARWYDRLGFERAEAWMRFNNQPSPLTLRANPFRTSPSALRDRLAAHGITTRAGAYAPASLVVEEGNPLTLHDEDIVGHFMVQDEASQLVPLLAGEHTGARVLDACASPGGKAVTLAAAMPAGGLLIACDVRDRRMALLRRTIDRTLARHVCLVQADLLALLPFRSVFSTVIVDAPCSGLGTLRRDPDIRWRRQASDLATLADAQSVMLDRAAQVVAPGGRLIYATCSTEPEENEQVVDALLQRSTDLRQLDARSTHPLLSPTLVDERGCLRTSPDVHQLEGFFGAVFEKRAAL
jgi:16S rRNA (cytosine967-C5)-methyltransferase